MHKNTIIIICENLQEAYTANAEIPASNDMNRFFLFVNEKPTIQQTEWIKLPDICFSLENLFLWSSDPESYIVRVGAFYSFAWNVLFCWGKNIPSKNEIEKAINGCESDEMCFLSEKIWGYSRDYFVQYGFGEKQTAETVDAFSMRDALDGIAVDDECLYLALQELAPLNSIQTHSNDMSPICKRTFDFIKNKNKLDENGETMLVSGIYSPDDIFEFRNRIIGFGCLIFITETNNESLYSNLKPYKILRNEDCSVLLFQKIVQQNYANKD